MKPLTLPYTIGDKTETLVISWPTGGNDSVHVMKDNYFIGQLTKYGDKWTFYPSAKQHALGPEEVDVIIEAVERHIEENK